MKVIKHRKVVYPQHHSSQSGHSVSKISHYDAIRSWFSNFLFAAKVPIRKVLNPGCILESPGECLKYLYLYVEIFEMLKLSWQRIGFSLTEMGPEHQH